MYMCMFFCVVTSKYRVVNLLVLGIMFINYYRHVPMREIVTLLTQTLSFQY